MAYSLDNISAVSSSNSNTGKFYMYKEAETLANMRASGYFDNAVDAGLDADDVIMLIGSDGIGFNQVNVSGSTYTLDEAITSI